MAFMAMLTIPYWGAVAAALGVAGMVSIGLLRLPWRGLRMPRLWLWGMIVLVALVYAWLGIFKYDSWQLGLWDFGIYDSLMHNMVSGGGWMTDFRGKFDHFSPVLILLAPFYAIWDHGYVLMIAQAVVMALAAWPLYEYARHYFPRNNLPLYVAVLYLLFPYYSRLVLFDFHVECFFPLLFFSAFYLYSRRRWRWFLTVLACAPLIKEDFVVPLAGCGLYFLCFSRRRMWGAGLLAAALGWTIFVLKIYYPLLLHVEYWHYGRYELSTGNLWSMFVRFFSPGSLAALTSLLLPAAFLPVLHWRSCLMILLPTLGVQMVSCSFQQSILTDHYGSAVLAVVPVLSIWGLRVWRWKMRHGKIALRRFAAISAAVLLAVAHVMFCDLATVRHHEYLSGYPLRFHGGVLSLPLGGEHWELMVARWAHAARVKSILPDFPEELTVVAQNDIGIHFLRRRSIQALPGTMNADIYCFDQANVIDYRDNKKLEEIAADPGYVLFLRHDDVLIFMKEHIVSARYPGKKR